MIKNYFKKFAIQILILTVVVGGVLLPHKTHAQVGVIEGGGSLFTQIATTISSAASSIANHSDSLKEYVLDPLVTLAAKTIIHEFTSSVIEWINNGFEGSPTFVTNPGGFLLDAADQMTGEFLAKNGGPLTDLCSNFSIDIRIALAFKFHQKSREKYKCTLGLIIKNSQKAIDGASINGRSIKGFVDGDFSQGGWPAFVSMTTETSNNVYGSYLEADSELSLRVASAQEKKTNEVTTGKGFVSWRDPKCKQKNKEDNAKIQKEYEARQNTDDYAAEYAGENKELKSNDNCPIKTPGSVIQESLQNNLNGPLRELELADEIDEIFGAAASQLIKMALQKGLAATTGSGRSDTTSELYKYRNEALKAGTTILDAKRNAFLADIGKYIKDTTDYQNEVNKALNIVLGVKNIYEEAKTCYADKKITSQPPLTTQQIEYANTKIKEIDDLITRDISPIQNPLLDKLRVATGYFVAFTKYKSDALVATKAEQVTTATQAFDADIRAERFVTATQISNIQKDIRDLPGIVDPLKPTAQLKLQECNAFPNGATTVTTGTTQ